MDNTSLLLAKTEPLPYDLPEKAHEDNMWQDKITRSEVITEANTKADERPRVRSMPPPLPPSKKIFHS